MSEIDVHAIRYAADHMRQRVRYLRDEFYYQNPGLERNPKIEPDFYAWLERYADDIHEALRPGDE